MRLLHVTLLAVLLSGCATRPSYEQKLAAYVGRHIDVVYFDMGPPNSVQRLNDGGQVVEILHLRRFTLDGYTTTAPQTTYHSGNATVHGSRDTTSATYSGTSTTYVQQQVPSETITTNCITRFLLDRHGYVVRYSFQGRAC